MVLSFSSELERIKDLYEEILSLQVYLQVIVTKWYNIVAMLTQLYQLYIVKTPLPLY